VTGESRYYRVPLEWGQRLSYLITEVGPAQPDLGYVGSIVWVDVYSPVRADITNLANTSGSTWFAQAADERPFTASTPYPVRYTNREGIDQRDFSLDGDYYLRVNADRNEDEPASTTFLITVVVSGEVEVGPVYQAAGAVTSSTSLSSTEKSSTAGTTAVASATTTAPPTTGSLLNTATNTSANGSVTTESGIPGWVWAVVGAFAAGAVAALLLVRYRRPTNATPPGGSDHNQQGDRR
jgi:Ca-activated chloride channel family protein